MNPESKASALPVAEQWYSRVSVDNDITLISEPYVDPLIRCNI